MSARVVCRHGQIDGLLRETIWRVRGRVAGVAAIISIKGLSKTYASGFRALENVDLEIRRGEIFALLGPNGAGKTTLIGIVCGLVNATSGTVIADGHDIVAQAAAARSKIGLVPQELSTDLFETVRATVAFSRGLFGKPPNAGHVEKVLRDLSLWEKRDDKIMTLSGGMKRRVLIAKALSHEPTILFLDEPTAGVDVELRRDMWAMVHKLREGGVTIILTTHYIEEAEQMADRVGVINKGRIILVEEKATLMKRLGKKQLRLRLAHELAKIPEALAGDELELSKDRMALVYTIHDAKRVAPLLRELDQLGIELADVQTHESTLEDIFVGLVKAS
jgi:ABC-2 type transport system ATP-binding protein